MTGSARLTHCDKFGCSLVPRSISENKMEYIMGFIYCPPKTVYKFSLSILFDRICQCKFKILGCEWQGIWSKLLQHETTCEFLTKSPDEIILSVQDRRASKHAKLMELLCADGTYMRGKC